VYRSSRKVKIRIVVQVDGLVKIIFQTITAKTSDARHEGFEEQGVLGSLRAANSKTGTCEKRTFCEAGKGGESSWESFLERTGFAGWRMSIP